MKTREERFGAIGRGIATVFVVLIAYWGLGWLMRLVRHGAWDVADMMVANGMNAKVVRFFAGFVINLLLAGIVVLYGRSTGHSLRRIGKEYLTGVAVSIGMIAAIAALSLLGGGVRWVGAMDFAAFDPVEFAAVMVLAMVNMREELIYRWWMMGEMKKRQLSTLWAVVISSVVFGLAHVGNPHVTPLAVVNLSLLGAFWALCYLHTGSLWLVVAMHSFWNFSQQRLLGLPMSGSSPRAGVLNLECVNSGIFATDAFGLEGNFATTLVLCVATAIMAAKLRQRRNEK